MDFWSIWFILGGIILALMTVLWLISLLVKNASIVDSFWGAGFVIFTWVAFWLIGGQGTLERKLLLNVLVTAWGLRLSMYILLRNLPKGEDFRYAKWRQEHGERWWWRSFFQVFVLQGVLMWIIALPLLAAQFTPAPLGLLDGLAALIWLVGFVFEVGGDWQLVCFKANPANKGKLLNTGFWRYTRHPNYFGDAVQWWGYFLIALAAGGWWTIFSPFIMTGLLRNVSGVSLLEKTLVETKPGYQAYVKNTNAFFPWLPRKS